RDTTIANGTEINEEINNDLLIVKPLPV
ncbi:MAG: hypothetical protein JWQ38_1548, partial [Flavipsychrobacter sp.]|nr:hypothetical protein [Flavipsychrobacter sp.]